MNYWVDRREGVHGIFENFLPFGENQIGRDHDAAALIALGEECEEDFHSQAFRGFLERERIEIIRLTAAKSPNLNAYAKRFMRSIKKEMIGTGHKTSVSPRKSRNS